MALQREGPMKKFICGFAADRIESTEHFYSIRIRKLTV